MSLHPVTGLLLQRCRAPAWRLLVAGAAALAVAACGGGGSDALQPAPDVVVGPPATAATLSRTADEAARAAQAAVAGAARVADRSGALSPLAALFGQPIAAQAAPNAAWVLPRALLPGRARPLAVTTQTCDALLDLPCSGTATLDTDIADTATAVVAGQYADVRFNALAGSLFGDTLTLNGRMRIDFLTGLDLEAPALQDLRLRVRLDALSVGVNGAVVGPLSELADLAVDASGNVSVVADGARFTELEGVFVNGAGSFEIGGGTVRSAYGTGGYADVDLRDWRSEAGRPVVGSSATVSAGGGSATIVVTSSSTSVVTYAVVLTVGGSGSVYAVTAVYPSGGGSPVYTAAPAT